MVPPHGPTLSTGHGLRAVLGSPALPVPNSSKAFSKAALSDRMMDDGWWLMVIIG